MDNEDHAFAAAGHVPPAIQTSPAGHCCHGYTVIKKPVLPAGLLKGRRVSTRLAVVGVLLSAATLAFRYDHGRLGGWQEQAFALIWTLVALAALVAFALSMFLTGWIAGYRDGYMVKCHPPQPCHGEGTN